MSNSFSGPVWTGEVAASPLGPIGLAVSPRGLVAIDLWGEPARLQAQVKRLTGTSPQHAPARVAGVATQLTAYFQKARKQFEVSIDWSVMTSFQQEVLRLVQAIEYGRTRTYNELAHAMGKPRAVRAVGRANATNPMPIILPCHRVVGANGRLQGYAAPGGVETKAWLLRLEGARLI